MDILELSSITELVSKQSRESAIALHVLRDVYSEVLQQFENSDGACNRLFNDRMRSINMVKFGEDV